MRMRQPGASHRPYRLDTGCLKPPRRAYR
jgi:hypothetical protein